MFFRLKKILLWKFRKLSDLLFKFYCLNVLSYENIERNICQQNWITCYGHEKTENVIFPFNCSGTVTEILLREWIWPDRCVRFFCINFAWFFFGGERERYLSNLPRRYFVVSWCNKLCSLSLRYSAELSLSGQAHWQRASNVRVNASQHLDSKNWIFF